MDERLIRWLLATILAIFLLLLSLPSSSAEGGDPAMIERGALLVAGAIADVVDGTGDALTGFGRGTRTRRQLKLDNQDLTQRVDQLETENLRLSTSVGRLRAMEEAVGFRNRAEVDLVPAEIVFRDDRSASPSWIVRAPRNRWRTGQPVLVVDGVVGRIVGGAGPYAKVQPLTDLDHAMGGMIERTRRQGVIRGGGRSRLTLEYIPRGSDVRLGDQVVTAGIDGVFPRGLRVGEVVSVQETEDLLLRIGLRPLVDFSTLEMVLLLGGEPVTEASVFPAQEPQ